MASAYAKSSLNWVGNKFRQLPQLMKIFPDKVDNFVDLFCGGCDVAQNMIGRANHIYANDINKMVMEILMEFQNKPIEEILSFVDARIKQFDLTKTNKEGYLEYRDLYNNGTYATPLDLFTLTRFSFNNNMRFNSEGKLNQAFGANRSSFNPTQRANTIKLHANLQKIILSNKSFVDFDLTPFGTNDFVYVDPPYLISDTFYNSGAKEVSQRWERADDLHLFEYLDAANAHGIKWAMSNFTHNKGMINKKLIEWIEGNHWNVHDINSSYVNCVHNKLKTSEPTVEVVVTNYD